MFNNIKDTITIRKKVDYKRQSNFLPTRPNLSVTPAQMMRMAEQGIPISSQNADKFYDGDVRLDWGSIPAERKRGVDITDLWNLKQGVFAKVATAHKQDVTTYGD